MNKSFVGSTMQTTSRPGLKVSALFKTGTKQAKQLKSNTKKLESNTKKLAKKVAPSKKALKSIPVAPGANRKGLSKGSNDELWLPNTERPDWLDGSLPGDRGFDPLGLAKPNSFLQVDLDQLDQNAAVNKAGQVVGQFTGTSKGLSAQSLQPYDEVFGLQRFRECELIHGRWAMLATLGVLVGEASTGVSWVDAGKVELDGAQYLGFSLPFSISQLVWIEAILVGGAEVYRNSSLDPETRLYPGGAFDPLGLSSDPERAFKLRTAEIKHARLAMVAFLGFSVQAFTTGQGALGSLAKFGESFAPELTSEIEAAVGQ